MSKKSTAKRGFKFNAMAIVFIMMVVPLAVAFISSSAYISSGEPQESIDKAAVGTSTPFKWVNNGHDVTSWYETNHPPTTPSYYNCLYIKDSICQGHDPALFPNTGSIAGVGQYATAGNSAPFNARLVPQTHADPAVLSTAPVGFAYYGGSGTGHFTFSTMGYQYDIDHTETFDIITLEMIQQGITYANTSTVFQNISFNSKVTFSYGGDSVTVDNGNINSNNQLCYNQNGTQLWQGTCAVGLKVSFDLTSFQSLEVSSMMDGDTDNLTITFDLYNFKSEDGNHIAGIELPFAGTGQFFFGLEASYVDGQALNVIVRGGAMVLGVACVLLAIASTPLYDPLKNRFKGAE